MSQADVADAPLADKALLTGRTGRDPLPERDVTIFVNGRPVTVRVRGLSRAEVLALQKHTGSGRGLLEIKMLALAMVNPRMTEGDVREWQEAAPAGELEPVTDAVEELSGVNDGAERAIYGGFQSGQLDEFRTLPGDEAGDDGRAAARHDG